METKVPDGTPATRDVWLRGLVMLLYMIAFAFGVWVLNFVAIAQFFWLLFVRQPNPFIAHFGNSLSAWLAEIGRFLTAATDERPFPWRPWPYAASSPSSDTASGR
jgi:Domain of unknown function (DUF4389)